MLSRLGSVSARCSSCQALPVERLCRSPTLPLSQRAGRAQPPVPRWRLNKVPAEHDERLEFLKGRNNERRHLVAEKQNLCYKLCWSPDRAAAHQRRRKMRLGHSGRCLSRGEKREGNPFETL
jgi:hypothetical protein